MAFLARMSTKFGMLRMMSKNVDVIKPLIPAASSGTLSSNAMREQMDTWQKTHELFNSSDRDLKKYPREGHGHFAPQIRLGFLPNSWFQFFYEKTGVTGPYMLGIGALTFLFSKEIWVFNHHFAHFISFWLVVYIINRSAGKFMNNYFDKELDVRDDSFLYQPIRETKEAVAENVDDVEKVIGQNETKLMLTDIKKENLALQLEALYRQRLDEAYRTTKKRLDYQIELQNAKAMYEREHMINWIVNNVMKSITPQHEKEALSTCIGRLKTLAKSGVTV